VITIEIHNDQSHVLPDAKRLHDAVRMIFQNQPICRARISLAVVDDPTIRRLNRRYLEEDEPTDVLSFLLERTEDCLEGEVIVSGQTAQRAAARFGWTPEDELLLYVIHGTLHLVGYRDATPAEQAAMRGQERACLARFGLQPRYEESGWRSAGGAAGQPRSDFGVPQGDSSLLGPRRSGKASTCLSTNDKEKKKVP
jgi:probable rRNA maturation factor